MARPQHAPRLRSAVADGPGPVRITRAGGTAVSDRCHVAASPLRRLRGLLGGPALREGEGLLLVPCASVHTLFLRSLIDVVFLDRDGKVLRVVPRLRPWRAAACRGARSVLELPPGTCDRTGVAPRERLLIVQRADATGQLLEQRPGDGGPALDEGAERPDGERPAAHVARGGDRR